MVRIHAMSGIEGDPGGLIHFRRRTAITAAKPPFTPTFAQNQSIVGSKSQWGLASGSGCLRRGDPSTPLRKLFNSSRSERTAGKCPKKVNLLLSDVARK